jgi:predicted Zn finger-like uncharacterized protein
MILAMKDNLTCPKCATIFRVPVKALGTEGRTVRCSQCKHAWHAMPEQLHTSTEHDLFASLFNDKKEQNVTAEEPLEKQEIYSFAESLFNDTQDEEDASEDGIVEEDATYIPDELEEEMPEAFSRPIVQAPPSPPFYSNLYVLSASNMVMLLMVVCTAALMWRESLTTKFPFMQRLYHMVEYENTEGLKLANVTFSAAKLAKNTRYVVRGQIVNEGQRGYIVPSIRARLFTKEGEMLEEWRFDNKAKADKPLEILAVGAQKAFSLKLPVAYKEAGLLAVDIGSPYEIDARK